MMMIIKWASCQAKCDVSVIVELTGSQQIQIGGRPSLGSQPPAHKNHSDKPTKQKPSNNQKPFRKTNQGGRAVATSHPCPQKITNQQNQQNQPADTDRGSPEQ